MPNLEAVRNRLAKVRDTIVPTDAEWCTESPSYQYCSNKTDTTTTNAIFVFSASEVYKWCDKISEQLGSSVSLIADLLSRVIINPPLSNSPVWSPHETVNLVELINDFSMLVEVGRLDTTSTAGANAEPSHMSSISFLKGDADKIAHIVTTRGVNEAYKNEIFRIFRMVGETIVFYRARHNKDDHYLSTKPTDLAQLFQISDRQEQTAFHANVSLIFECMTRKANSTDILFTPRYLLPCIAHLVKTYTRYLYALCDVAMKKLSPAIIDMTKFQLCEAKLRKAHFKKVHTAEELPTDLQAFKQHLLDNAGTYAAVTSAAFALGAVGSAQRSNSDRYYPRRSS